MVTAPTWMKARRNRWTWPWTQVANPGASGCSAPSSLMVGLVRCTAASRAEARDHRFEVAPCGLEDGAWGRDQREVVDALVLLEDEEQELAVDAVELGDHVRAHRLPVG